ncbi:hypothetical protein [Methanobrevibacter sp.]
MHNNVKFYPFKFITIIHHIYYIISKTYSADYNINLISFKFNA